MAARNNPQFDPIAAATLGAIDASQRGIQSVQGQSGAPQLPAQNQAFSQGRSLIQTVAQFSPANVLMGGNGPSLPGGQAGGLPSPQNFLPDLGGAGGPPSPQQMVQQAAPTGGGTPTATSGGSNSQASSGSRTATESRT